MKLTKILLASALLGASILSFHSTVAARDLQVELGMAAYEAGDYAEAAKSLKDSAIMGDPEAQFMLGRMFYKGQFFKQDYVEAVKWYRKSAEQGNNWGLIFLAGMYEKGEGVEKDFAEAIKLYSKAAKQGDKIAQFYLGVMYHNIGNKVKAKELFKKSCKQGLENACKVLKSYK